MWLCIEKCGSKLHKRKFVELGSVVNLEAPSAITRFWRGVLPTSTDGFDAHYIPVGVRPSHSRDVRRMEWGFGPWGERGWTLKRVKLRK